MIDFGPEDLRDAESIVGEAWELLDRLDAELSNYRYASDVSILNSVAEPKGVLVRKATIQCLDEAVRYHRQTMGAFDITLGPVIRAWKESDVRKGLEPSGLAKAIARVGMDGFEMTIPRVLVKRVSMQLDLGAIGKGFDLDRMGTLLKNAGVERALLGSGGSTVLAFGGGEWPMTLPDRVEKRSLSDGALSTSANPHRHIIDPKTYHPAVSAYAFTMVGAPSAAKEDALSTAFMVLPEDRIREICEQDPAIGVRLYKDRTEKPVSIGASIYFEFP